MLQKGNNLMLTRLTTVATLVRAFFITVVVSLLAISEVLHVYIQSKQSARTPKKQNGYHIRSP